MNVHKPVRKPNRLPGFDYSRCGAYFITICTAGKKNILCSIRETDVPFQPAVELTDLGSIAQEMLKRQETSAVSVENYVIMPNHIHLLLQVSGVYAQKTISNFVGRYKSLVANRWLRTCKNRKRRMGAIWQRSFYDHIVRNPMDFQRIWLYIAGNPSRWREDCFYLEQEADSRKGCPYVGFSQEGTP